MCSCRGESTKEKCVLVVVACLLSSLSLSLFLSLPVSLSPSLPLSLSPSLSLFFFLFCEIYPINKHIRQFVQTGGHAAWCTYFRVGSQLLCARPSCSAAWVEGPPLAWDDRCFGAPARGIGADSRQPQPRAPRHLLSQANGDLSAQPAGQESIVDKRCDPTRNYVHQAAWPPEATYMCGWALQDFNALNAVLDKNL